MAANMSPEEAARVGLQLLHHNSSLVQFADQKAATLIIVNSIFLASGGMAGGPFGFACLACSALALLLCLLVVVARRGDSSGVERSAGLIFFEDILRLKSPQGYLATLRSQSPDAFAETVLSSVFRTCAIARRKYRCYSWALGLTMAGAALWMATMAGRLLPH